MSTSSIPVKKEGGGIPLRYTLTAEQYYLTGQPVKIDFTLENMTGEDLFILTWYTPLEGLKGKIFEVMCDSRMIPYEGRMVKRGDPPQEDYIRIVEHGSVSAAVDLAEVYRFPACQECRVKFKGRIHDILRNENLLPRRSNDHQWMDIPGNPVSFRIKDA